MAQFPVGSRVMFPGRNGRTVYGTVRRVNPKTYSIDQCSDGAPNGWRVPPYMLKAADASDPGAQAATAPAGERPWRKGDRVAFDFNGRTVTGTIDRVNARTCSITPDVPDRPGQYYRISPRNLRPTGAASTAPTTPAAPRVDTTAADKALWEAMADGYGLPADAFGKTFKVKGTEYRITGLVPSRPKYPVSAVRVRDNRGFKFHESTVRFALAASTRITAPTKPAAKRSEDAIMDDILSVYVKLSPENISHDGERSRSEINRARADLNRQLRALFTEIGREVSETEAWAYLDRKTA